MTKNKPKKKKNYMDRFMRTCEQCGNEYFMRKPVSWCPFCMYENDFRKVKKYESK